MKSGKKWAICLLGALFATLSVSFTAFAKYEEKIFTLAGVTGEMYSACVPAYVMEENGQYLVRRHSAVLDTGANSYVIYNEIRGEGKMGSSGTDGTRTRAVPKRGGGPGKFLLFSVMAVVGIAVIAAFVKKAKEAEEASPARQGSKPSSASKSGETSGAAANPASARVEGIAGPMMGRVYSVKSAGLSFGRDASCFVCLPAEAKGVSRVHCKLYLDGQGRLMLMDCGSSYGTYLHGFGKLSPRQPVAVNKGSVFYLGSKKIGFKIQ